MRDGACWDCRNDFVGTQKDSCFMLVMSYNPGTCVFIFHVSSVYDADGGIVVQSYISKYQ